MIVFLVMICIFIEYRFSPRVDFVRESSVFVFYFFALKNERRKIIFKI